MDTAGIDRRRFLGRTVATGAAMSVAGALSSATHAADTSAATNNRIKVGVIGLGFSVFSGETVFDPGRTHRTITLPDSPKSYDTRLIGSVRVGF